MKIWCLFSVANNYNQPDNNLECFWSTKPTFQDIKKLLKFSDEICGRLFRGEEVNFPGERELRIEEVEDGKIL